MAKCKSPVGVAVGCWMAVALGLSAPVSAGFAGLVQSGSSAPQAFSLMPSLTGLPPGTKIIAALQTTLDVLALKNGDEISARVTRNLKRGGRILVHKGDRLVGRVTSVQAQKVDKGQEDSMVAIVFDRLTSGRKTYRLNTVIRSVDWMPGRRRGMSIDPDEAPPTPGHARVLRGPHPGPASGAGAAGSRGGGGVPGARTGVGHVDKQTESGGDFPQGGAAPSDSIKAQSDKTPDSHTDVVTVLRDRKGNLRLRRGTHLEFRTQGK